MKTAKTKMDLVDQVRKDIQNFKEQYDARRLVMVWCGSTETYLQPSPVHSSLEKFEIGLKEMDALF